MAEIRTGSSGVLRLQAEYNAWRKARPALTIRGMNLYGGDFNTDAPALAEWEYGPPNFVSDDGQLRRSTLAIPLYMCRWRLLSILARIEEAELKKYRGSTANLSSWHHEYQLKGFVNLSEEENRNQAIALVLAHKALLRFAQRVRAIPSALPQFAGSWHCPFGGYHQDDCLDADLLPAGTLEELAELQADMQDAVLFAEDLHAAYEDRRLQ